MSRVLMVDDTTVTNDLLAQLVRDRLGWDVVAVDRPEDALDLLTAGQVFNIAIVDLSYPNSAFSGLDVLIAIYEHDPSCRLVVYTDGDPPVANLLRDTWEALPIATALSKSSPLPEFLRSLREVDWTGTAPIDPVLAPLLPTRRSEWRSLEGYGRLVTHAGQAKLWKALIEMDGEPSYQELAAHVGLKPDTVRNYRTELLDELALHDLDRPKMRHMAEFAKRCRPLLMPHIRRKLDQND